MSTASIRRATPSDVPFASALGAEIVRLHHAQNPKRFFLPDNVEQGYAFWLTKELTRKEAVVLVAELEGNVVGYCYGTLEEPDWGVLVGHHGVIQDVCVAASARRLGIGRTLAQAMIAELTALGAPRILIYAMGENEPALGLARSLGFAPTMVEMTRESDAEPRVAEPNDSSNGN